MRNGRYVVPIKADNKGKIPGIIHDSSSSGATLSIEPLETVELNNQWREMQLEKEKHARRYSEALEEKKVLEQISVDRVAHRVLPGSLVITNEGNFFISLGLGKIKASSIEAFAIASGSPFGLLLKEKKSGDKLLFNGRQYIIEQVL